MQVYFIFYFFFFACVLRSTQRLSVCLTIFFSTRCNDSRRDVSNQITSNWFFFLYILFHSPVCAKHTAHNHKRIHIIFIYACRDTWKCFNTILDDFLLCSFVFLLHAKNAEAVNGMIWWIWLLWIYRHSTRSYVVLFYFIIIWLLHVTFAHEVCHRTATTASHTWSLLRQCNGHHFFFFFIFIDACSLLLLRKKFID